MGIGTLVSLQPPPQYDVVPPVPVIERILSREELQKVCGAIRAEGVQRVCGALRGEESQKACVTYYQLGPGEWFRGCTTPRAVRAATTVCLVYRIDDELVRRHEWAHCAGWPADHPGGK
jgi:hypothetical protein